VAEQKRTPTPSVVSLEPINIGDREAQEQELGTRLGYERCGKTEANGAIANFSDLQSLGIQNA
jgi:hypothetical protein